MQMQSLRVVQDIACWATHEFKKECRTRRDRLFSSPFEDAAPGKLEWVQALGEERGEGREKISDNRAGNSEMDWKVL